LRIGSNFHAGTKTAFNYKQLDYYEPKKLLLQLTLCIIKHMVYLTIIVMLSNM